MTTNPFEIDEEALERFVMSMTGAELEAFRQTSTVNDDDLESAGLTAVLPQLTVRAAHRLGHRKITLTDAQAISLADSLRLIDKASNVSPHKNQRTADLLAELGE